MNEGATKKWSEGYYMNYLLQHGGYAEHYYLTTIKKKNDMTDAGNQIKGFIIEMKIQEYDIIIYDEEHSDSCFRGLPVSKDYYQLAIDLKLYLHPPITTFNISSNTQPTFNISSNIQPVFNLNNTQPTLNITSNSQHIFNISAQPLLNVSSVKAKKKKDLSVMPVFNVQPTALTTPLNNQTFFNLQI
jgi:hypothetical protein